MNRKELALVVLNKRNRRDLIVKAMSQPTGEPVYAEMNHGRWLVLCKCMGAELVDPQLPEFYCLSCFNAFNNGLPCPVIFPDKREAIEELLNVRPDRVSRNWTRLETGEDLEKENAEHGLSKVKKPRGAKKK